MVFENQFQANLVGNITLDLKFLEASGAVRGGGAPYGGCGQAMYSLSNLQSNGASCKKMLL